MYYYYNKSHEIVKLHACTYNKLIISVRCKLSSYEHMLNMEYLCLLLPEWEKRKLAVRTHQFE